MTAERTVKHRAAAYRGKNFSKKPGKGAVTGGRMEEEQYRIGLR